MSHYEQGKAKLQAIYEEISGIVLNAGMEMTVMLNEEHDAVIDIHFNDGPAPSISFEEISIDELVRRRESGE